MGRACVAALGGGWAEVKRSLRARASLEPGPCAAEGREYRGPAAAPRDPQRAMKPSPHRGARSRSYENQLLLLARLLAAAGYAVFEQVATDGRSALDVVDGGRRLEEGPDWEVFIAGVALLGTSIVMSWLAGATR